MAEAEQTTCPGCRVALPAQPGLPTHPYIGASPECWARFGELCAREYEDSAYLHVHQLTVDAYAAQHPGKRERRTIQSVAVHLMTLAMVLEDGLDPRQGPRLHKRMVRRADYEWLDSPSMEGRMTVLDVLEAKAPGAHELLVRAWAEEVWEAWAAHHRTVRLWIDRGLPCRRRRNVSSGKVFASTRGRTEMRRLTALCVVLGMGVVLAATAAADHPGRGGTPFFATLTPEAECNAAGVCGLGQPGAAGETTLRLNSGQQEVCFRTTARGLTTPVTGAHIHQAPAGVAGPIVVPLSPPVGDGCVSAPRELIEEIRKNPENFYVNVHTSGRPAGAIRGQLCGPGRGNC